MARQAINTSNNVAYFNRTYVYFFALKFTTFTRRGYYMAKQSLKSSDSWSVEIIMFLHRFIFQFIDGICGGMLGLTWHDSV